MITSLQEMMNVMGAPSGMTTKQLMKLYISHLEEWKPKMYQELLQANSLKTYALKAAEKVQKGLAQAKEHGLPFHEVESELLKRYVLLPPEQEVIDEMERE